MSTITTVRSGFAAVAEAVGGTTLGIVEDLGGVALLGWATIKAAARPPYRIYLALYQMQFIGVGSIFIVALTGLFTGMIFAKQSVYAFGLFNARALVGPTVVITVTRELSPVFAALMVTMRAGSAICTELGTMRVTEQIDALETLAVNPEQYLVAPRVVAGLVMLPCLTMVFDVAGFGGGYFVAVIVELLGYRTFMDRTQFYVDPEDIWQGLVKAAVFGVVITLVCCFKGFHAKGGATGVGVATTQAMVLSAVLVFVLDYFLNLLLIPSLQ
jgi:phospholipid/cholesterol/gamma-HCH transport system permease protein